MKSTTVPRLARWLLEVVTPRIERAELLGDLEDDTARREAVDGRSAARRWYRRQVVRSVGPIVGRRLSVRARRWRAVGPTALSSGTVQDLKLAIRSLAASPAFALSTVAMLALGIGTFTVIYAFVDAAVIRPLPFGERSDRLVTVHSVHPTLTSDVDDAGMSYADVIELRQASTTLERLEGVIDRTVGCRAAPWSHVRASRRR
jgi:hypothetical protein